MKSSFRIFLISCILFYCCSIIAQNSYQMKANDKYVEIDILSSYYSQDGNNSPVTGGIGTEQLTDFANIIVVNIPIDSTKSINFSGGLDIYSSASTDNIDNNRSSASSKDTRYYANLGYTQKNLKSGFTYGGRIGISSEYDYVSINGGINIAKEFNRGNTEFSFSGQAFFDNWKLYFPSELRGEVNVPTKSRRSYNGQFTWSQVLDKRLQFSLSAEFIYMEGLLSTPFHRVYFSDQAQPDIERLPASRLKIPLAVRLNYKPTDNLSIRTYYRFYSDDFGINAHTANIEIPINVNENWTFSPFYRFHSQTSSDYFNPYGIARSSDTYYSSDYDLSKLNSSKYGIGVSFAPLYGLARSKLPFTKKVIMINSVSMRLSKYTRNTAFSGYNVSLGFNVRI